jgi:hypothetical protein
MKITDEMKKIILNLVLTILLGAIAGLILGFLFFLVPVFLGSTGTTGDHFGNWAPGPSWVLGIMYGVPLGVIFTPFFYFLFLRKVGINFRVICICFTYTLFAGLPGFLTLFPLGVVTALLGFLMACVKLNKEIVGKEKNA